MAENLIAVPVSALSTYDYSEPQSGKGKPKMIDPEVGDPVDFRVRGSVARIEGEKAFVKVAFVNDRRASMADAGEDDTIDGGEGEPDGDESLESMAARLDKQSEEDF